MNGNSSNDVGTYQFKHKTIQDRLVASYLVFVNAPDPAHNSLGYIVSAGPEPLHVRVFENFAVFCVGGTSSDIREADDYLDLLAQDVHKDWSKADFHGAQASRFMRQIFRMTHQDTVDLEMIAAEMIIIDYGAKKAHAVRYDGTQEDFKLGDGRFLAWVGSHSKAVRRTVTGVIDRHLPDNTAGTEQFTTTEGRLKAEYKDVKNVLVRSVKETHE